MTDGASAIQPTVRTPPPGATLSSQAAFAAMAASVVAAGPGQPELPGYRLLRQIAQGGMGTVWLAEHETLQRTVALKVMRPELARDQAFVERFVREARSAARVHHPGVVSVHDAGVAGGHLYLAMEYVPGGDLAARMERGRLPEAEAVTLIGQIAEALQAIHDAGLVHRDPNPENILRDEQGRPKIADLGLARASEGDDRMTATGQALGTPAYMSPEQANGVADIDARSDVYSLAATLYALVTGAPPFTGPTPWATVAKVINEPPPDPRLANPGLSPALAAAVVRALAKDRAQRQPTARAFAAEVIAAPGVDLFAPRPKRWWQNRWVVGVGGVYLMVGLIGAAVSIASAKPARATAPAPRVAKAAAPIAPAAPATPTAPSARAETSRVAANLGGALRSVKSAVRGTVLDTVDGRVATVHRAVVAALRRNGLALTRDLHDAASATIEAAFADGGEVRITLGVLAADTTQVAVQIGPFGDERKSRTLLAWIRDEL